MSIGGIMRTSVSGMNAQATRLSAVADNIANSDTTGYKHSQTEFSSLLLPQNTAGYNSGAVEAQIRTQVSQQGGISYTGNDNNAKKIDLAVNGNGFLVVSDGSGGSFLTRAGAFTQQPDGTLVNSAGFTLQGYPVGSTGTDNVLNGFAGLQDINLKTALLSANPTTEGILTVPLDKTKSSIVTEGSFTQTAPLGALAAAAPLGFNIEVDNDGTVIPISLTGPMTPQQIVDGINAQVLAAAPANTGPVASLDADGRLILTSNGAEQGSASTIEVTNVTPAFAGLNGFLAADAAGADRPSFNISNPSADSVTTTRNSITVYNNSGEAVKLDIYYTKTADETWEVAIFDSRKASTGLSSSPFPYGEPGEAPLATAQMNFNDTTFTLDSITSGTNTQSPGEGILAIDLTSIGGGNFNLFLGNTTQFTGEQPPLEAAVNGNPAEVIEQLQIGKDGTITALFGSGTTRDLFRIPLALVNSPDNMEALAGNVFNPGVESGTILMGFGGSGGFGDLTAGALEDSTVDLASELTTMIESQRSYTANSKVFQTGSEILDVLVNLKR